MHTSLSVTHCTITGTQQNLAGTSVHTCNHTAMNTAMHITFNHVTKSIKSHTQAATAHRHTLTCHCTAATAHRDLHYMSTPIEIHLQIKYHIQLGLVDQSLWYTVRKESGVSSQGHIYFPAGGHFIWNVKLLGLSSINPFGCLYHVPNLGPLGPLKSWHLKHNCSRPLFTFADLTSSF